MNKIIKLNKQEINFVSGAFDANNNEQEEIRSNIIVIFACIGVAATLFYVCKRIFNGLDRQERRFYNKAHFTKPPKFFDKGTA